MSYFTSAAYVLLQFLPIRSTWIRYQIHLYCYLYTGRIKQNMHKIQCYWNKRSSPYWILRVSISARLLMRRPRCVEPMLSPEYECGKRNLLYPIRATSFVSIVMYLTCTIRVFLKKQIVWHLIQLQLSNWFIYTNVSPIKCVLKKCQVSKVIKYISLCTHKPRYFLFIAIHFL